MDTDDKQYNSSLLSYIMNYSIVPPKFPIQGTRGGVVTPRDWGVTTQKGKTLYVHVLNLDDKALFLPYAGNKLKSAVEYQSRKSIRFIQDRDGILLKFTDKPHSPDYVLELTFANELPLN